MAMGAIGIFLYTVAQLLAMPDPQWLVNGVLPESGLAVVYGPSGVGKSFVALDLALSIATGRDWNAHKVEAGTVVYVAAEGSVGVQQRVRAWLKVSGMEDTPNAFFVLNSVSVPDEE